MARRRYDVAVMHDFFVDRLVHIKDLAELLDHAKAKSKQGGGSLHDIKQEDVRGGNAVNLAHALGALGARVLLLTHSDAEHRGYLRKTFKRLRVEVRIKPLPPGLTVALEERVNVMVSHSGGAAHFPPSLITEGEWDSMRACKVVCSANWAVNEHGTELLEALRQKLGERAVLHLGTADVRDRMRRYSGLVRLMKRSRVADWLSLNEYEARSTITALGLAAGEPGRMCGAISGQLGIRVDVHTEYASYTSSDGTVVERRTDHVKPKRLTGAGDVWDAASVYASLKGMSDEERLLFANAAARLYVLSERVEPPTLRQVVRSLG